MCVSKLGRLCVTSVSFPFSFESIPRPRPHPLPPSPSLQSFPNSFHSPCFLVTFDAQCSRPPHQLKFEHCCSVETPFNVTLSLFLLSRPDRLLQRPSIRPPAAKMSCPSLPSRHSSMCSRKSCVKIGSCRRTSSSFREMLTSSRTQRP